MDLRVLEYFLAVAEEQNLTRAAEKVTTSQSNISHQIKSLERELGCALFTRGDNYFSLTEQGLYLRKQAKELLALSEKTRETILNFDSDTSGEVRIGGAETGAIHIIGRTIRRMQEKHPGIRYYIGSGADYDVFEPLDRGILDFALVVPPVNKEKYNWRLMPMKDEIGFLVPAGHPLAKLESITPEELKAYPIQVGGDALKRQGLGTVWEKAAEEVQAIVTFNLVTNPMLMVQDGVGCSLTLKNLLQEPADGSLVFRPLDPKLEYSIYLVWQKYQLLSRPAQLFLEELELLLAKAEITA